MTMTCVDHTMVRRDRSRVGFISAFAEFAGFLGRFSRRRKGKVEDLNDHMLRDIGFFDGRTTEAAMRRAAGCRGGWDQF